jgi:hypothetical protein
LAASLVLNAGFTPDTFDQMAIKDLIWWVAAINSYQKIEQDNAKKG